MKVAGNIVFFLFLVLFPCSFRNLPTRVVVSQVVNVISFYLKKTGFEKFSKLVVIKSLFLKFDEDKNGADRVVIKVIYISDRWIYIQVAS